MDISCSVVCAWILGCGSRFGADDLAVGSLRRLCSCFGVLSVCGIICVVILSLGSAIGCTVSFSKNFADSAVIQRVSWYVRHDEKEFTERVREASDQNQEKTVKECKQKISKAQKRHKELDGLVKKLYEGNATGKIPDKHFTRLLAEYDEEQTGLETSIAEWQRQIESWNADKLKTDQFIQLVKRYTDFSELTTPMLNEFIEKVIVHEGEGRGNDRRQRIDIYLNFIGAFEVPAHIVTPAEVEEQRRQQEEQAAKEARSKELEKARYEKRKAEKREFTAIPFCGKKEN